MPVDSTFGTTLTKSGQLLNWNNLSRSEWWSRESNALCIEMQEGCTNQFPIIKTLNDEICNQKYYFLEGFSIPISTLIRMEKTHRKVCCSKYLISWVKIILFRILSNIARYHMRIQHEAFSANTPPFLPPIQILTSYAEHCLIKPYITLQIAN